MFAAVLVLALAYPNNLEASLHQIPASNQYFSLNTYNSEFPSEADIIRSRRFVKQRSDRTKRSSITNTFRNYKWSDGVIPYTLSSTYTYVEKAGIIVAMDAIEQHSCIRFVQRRNQDDYLRIFPNHTGDCSSFIGRQGGRQDLSLGQQCLVGAQSHSIVLHELMHAIGFFHEHNRPDRDQYIRIKWNNIRPGADTVEQFEKLFQHQVNYLNTEYDYGSIMHYGRYLFSRNRLSLETIRPLKPTSVEIGTANTLSATDVLRINRLYNCSGTDSSVRKVAPAFAEVNTACFDKRIYCQRRSHHGYCSHRRWSVEKLMRQNCPASCGVCSSVEVSSFEPTNQTSGLPPIMSSGSLPTGICRDDNAKCAHWQIRGLCDTLRYFMGKHCRKSCLKCRNI